MRSKRAQSPNRLRIGFVLGAFTLELDPITAMVFLELTGQDGGNGTDMTHGKASKSKEIEHQDTRFMNGQ
jgi:hypothetical protein